ncbi:MAG: asparagine synthase (glutamine-hydrolyzing) [Patescibacteria group bacterium]
MCGISGFNFQDTNLIEAMNKKVHHRGPDDNGLYVEQGISLGHTRLSIIDLSEKGRQPIFNEDKSLVIVFNGEIYNYQELKKELSSRHKFYTQTDTEVLLHLYEELGPECLQKLNGIFAFAIWDKRKQELFLARDRMGIKPLYYYHAHNKFIFSSEIKAILAHKEVEREVNIGSINHYFNLGFVPQPLTAFNNIHKLPSAHYLIFKNNKAYTKKYWQVNDFKNLKNREVIENQIDYLVNDSIKHQLISDRPVGIFLSGGIDSNVVVGVAKKYLPHKIKTYTVGFEAIHGHKFNADFELAQKTSQFHQTDHHTLIINEKDIIDNLEDVIYHIDDPINNGSQIAVYLLARLAKQDVAVVLSGGGGDELFGGYPRYFYNRLIDRWQSLPSFLQSKLLLTLASKVTKKDIYSKFTATNMNRYSQFMFRKNEDIKKILKPEIWHKNVTRDFYQEKFFANIDPVFKKDFTKYFGMVDRQTWLLDLGLVMEDKITMASGLEERVPLLDHRLVELSAKIPTKFKIRGKDTKHIFKSAMQKYIAPHVFDEPKRGFASPVSEWLRTGLYDFTKHILSPDYCPATKRYFDFKMVNKIFEDHVHKRKYNMLLVWGIMTWQVWYKKFIEKQ